MSNLHLLVESRVLIRHRNITLYYLLFILLQIIHFFTFIIIGFNLLLVLFSSYFSGNFFGQSFSILSDLVWLPILIGLLKKKRWSWLLAVISSLLTMIPLLIYIAQSTDWLSYAMLSVAVMYLVLLLINRRYFFNH